MTGTSVVAAIKDAGLLLGLVLLIPAVIVIVGTPLALAVRLLVEVLQRLW